VGSWQVCFRQIRMEYRRWVAVGLIEVYAVTQCRLSLGDVSRRGWCVVDEFEVRHSCFATVPFASVEES